MSAHPRTWRHALRRNPTTRAAYRVTVFLLGLLVVAVGLLLVPLPGPGWFIVLFGIAIWASEFDRAHRLLHWVRERLHEWHEWVRPRPPWVKAAAGLAVLAAVLALFWVWFRLTGIPAYLPEPVRSLMAAVGL